ncbi:MAG: serine protease [Legionella sp.]|nr:serine protease [Legionella sp.]
MTSSKPNSIQIQSVQSLFLRMYFNDILLATGTGFTIATPCGHALITNRHNFTGRNPYTDEVLSSHGGVPNKVEIFHNVKNKLGSWKSIKQTLYDDPEIMQKPLWHEHPKLGKQADVVALSLQLNDSVICYPYSLDEKNKIAINPADIVSVIGFPFGKTAGGCLAIWATGFMASEPNLTYEGMPKFLIDCRSRQGQSGSPVVAHRNGGAVAMEGGNTAIFTNPITNLLGVYSGRINAESDLGIVWKTNVIGEILATL